jgi:hypothetical protein
MEKVKTNLPLSSNALFVLVKRYLKKDASSKAINLSYKYATP